MFCKIARDLLHLQLTFWEISVLCKMFLPILSSGVNKTGKYESFLLLNILALFFVSLAVLVCWPEHLHTYIVHSLIDSQCASRSKSKICCSEFRSDQIFRKKTQKVQKGELFQQIGRIELVKYACGHFNLSWERPYQSLLCIFHYLLYYKRNYWKHSITCGFKGSMISL